MNHQGTKATKKRQRQPVKPSSWRIQVKFVRQPTQLTCIHACLSMVTGVAVAELIERFGNHGLDRETEITVLTEYGIMPELLPEEHAWLFSGVYLMTVPSLNMLGHTHRIVVFEDVAANAWKIYDPNRTRRGVKHHSVRAFARKRQEPPVSYTEITYLRPLRLHRGSLDRVDLYAKRRAP